MLNFIKAIALTIVIKISSPLGVFTSDANKFDPQNLDPIFKEKKMLTPLSQEEIAIVLCKTHIDLYGAPPSKNKLALSWAQIALENSRGKRIWNNNLGNQGPFRMNQRYYHHKFNGWPYRSFGSVDESAKSYWKIIKKCKMADITFDRGDPVQSARSLKGCNYYSSDLKEYSKVLSSLYYEAQKKIIPKINCGQN